MMKRGGKGKSKGKERELEILDRDELFWTRVSF